MSEHIQYDFLYDNHFTELKETELLNERLNYLLLLNHMLVSIILKIGLRRNVLRQTDEEIT